MNSENTTTSMKCSNCKKEKTIDFFRLKKGSSTKYNKTCSICLKSIYKNRQKCPCGKRPTFGYKNDKKPTCCFNCKKKDMVDIVSRKCECGKRAYFGYDGDKYASCCNVCKKEDMVDIVSRKCECGSGKKPRFGYDGDEYATWCNDCKKENMINFSNRNRPKCECGKRPTFGYKDDEYPTCCAICKKEDMVDIVSRKCECGKTPSFGYDGDKPICCKDCKKTGMIDIKNKHRLCKNSSCNYQISNPCYEGYCAKCFREKYPDKQTVINYKIKENTVVDYIKQKLPDYDFVVDKYIPYSKYKRRPDMLVDFGTHVSIIEIDENKHVDSKYKDAENERMKEIVFDLGLRPTVFIRFNPDGYVDKHTKKKVKGLFVVDKGTGRLGIGSMEEFEKRVGVLIERFESFVGRPLDNTDLIRTEYLFYD